MTLSPASFVLASFAKIIYLNISEQELRRAVEGFNSPSPQPEDPGRVFDVGLVEDPDITVELVNGTCYQARCDGASVAIVTDYTGLLPASRVSKAKTLSSEEDSFLIPCLMPKVSYL